MLNTLTGMQRSHDNMSWMGKGMPNNEQEFLRIVTKIQNIKDNQI